MLKPKIKIEDWPLWSNLFIKRCFIPVFADSMCSLFCWAGAFIGDGFSAEAIFPDPGFYIRRVPSGQERDEEHSAPALETDAIDFCADMLPDSGFDGGVYVSPEVHDVRVWRAPGIPKSSICCDY